MSTTWKMPQAPPPLPSPVASRRREQRGAPPEVAERRTWRNFQSSGISLAVHCALFLLLALLGSGSIGTPTNGIQQPVLVEMVAGGDSSEGIFVENVGATVLGSDASVGGDESAGGGEAALPGAESAPLDVGSVLAGIDPGEGGSGIGDVGEAAGGVGLGNGGPQLGGSASIPKVKTSVFGIEGVGTRFVYVSTARAA